MWERSDYILGTDRHHFEMVGIRGVRKYPSVHLVLRNRLLIFWSNAGHHCNAGVPSSQMVTVHGGIEDNGNYHTHAGMRSGRAEGDIVTSRRM